jgi:hypothetical protein
MEVFSSQSKKRGHSQFLEYNSVVCSQNKKPLVVSTEQDRLCTRCRTIDLEAIFRMKIKLGRGSFIADLGASVATLKASECAMCQLFGSVSPSDFDSEGSARSELCHLRAFSANRVFARIKASEMREIDDTTLLGVVRVKISDANSGRNDSLDNLTDGLEETGYLCPIQANQRQSILEIRHLSSTSFDLGFALESLAYCSVNHRQTCSIMETPQIRSLRVIDCQTRTIIRAPAMCQYVALSYVWGASTTSTANFENPNNPPTIQNAPKVINDAIDVTLNLGFRYLWIDRHCIDQSNKDEKHNTISVMDLIYSNARLTIIAAAGDNPEYGLPGVNGTVRRVQPRLEVGELSLVSTLPHPEWSIKHSTWAGRGWTYQEGLLSKRRLVFTDYQVFYECNGMHCAESLILPRDQLHVKSKKEFKIDVARGAFDYKDPGKKPWEIMAYVAEFSRRHLTFPSDAVNAMQGIFHSFSNGRRPLYHFVGVPIPPPESAHNYHTIYKATHRTFEERFLVGLSWYHTKAIGRREEFPSWSWAGWRGELHVNLMVLPGSSSRFKNVRVWIEGDQGTLSDFPTSATSQPCSLQAYSQVRFIHIEAFTIPLSIVYLQKNHILASAREHHRGLLESSVQSDGYYIKSEVDKNLYIYARMHLDHRDQDILSGSSERNRNDLIGILVGEQNIRSGGFVLVIQDMKGYSERVGLFNFHDFSTMLLHEDAYFHWSFSVDLSFQTYQKWFNDLPRIKRTIRLG